MAILAPNDTWGDPIQSWDYSAPVANVDFINLGDYRELLIIGESVGSDTGATSALTLLTSTNNGSSFASTGYVNIGGSSVALVLLTGAVATATPQGFIIQAFNLNAASYKTRFLTSAGTEGSATAAATRIGQKSAEVNNALRFAWTSAANFATGSIRVYGKRG